MNICWAIAEADWELTKDIFGIVGTVVSTAGFVAACYFGSKGLSAWKKQLQGNFDHGLAMKVLVELYKFRDSVISAREPMITLEGLNFGAASLPEDTLQRDFILVTEALKLRYDKVSTIKAQLEVAAFDCEAAWGDFLKNSLGALFDLHRELKSDVDRFLYMANPNASHEGKRVYTMFHGERTNIIFDDRGAPSVRFNSSFGAALGAVEQNLKAKVAA